MPRYARAAAGVGFTFNYLGKRQQYARVCGSSSRTVAAGLGPGRAPSWGSAAGCAYTVRPWQGPWQAGPARPPGGCSTGGAGRRVVGGGEARHCNPTVVFVSNALRRRRIQSARSGTARPDPVKSFPPSPPPPLAPPLPSSAGIMPRGTDERRAPAIAAIITRDKTQTTTGSPRCGKGSSRRRPIVAGMGGRPRD